jgi:competence protein ComFC
MRLFFREYWHGLSHFLFPFQCLGCSHGLDADEELLCGTCATSLPYTYYWNDPSNPVAQMFWGKLDLQGACSFLYFYQGGRVQRLLHALKYEQQAEAGVWLGKAFGSELLWSSFAQCDVLIPVPLHPKKEKQRGYNQCAVIGKAMADEMGLSFRPDILYRTEHHESQTKKGRYDRWLNVKQRFNIRPEVSMSGMHVLLIDDVVTTGATLEACAQTLIHQAGVRVSVATVACPAPF